MLFALARVFLASLVEYVFRWSVSFHRVARLSKYRTVKAGHPRSALSQENECRTGPIGLFLPHRTRGLFLILVPLHVLALVGFVLAAHDGHFRLKESAHIIHF